MHVCMHVYLADCLLVDSELSKTLTLNVCMCMYACDNLFVDRETQGLQAWAPHSVCMHVCVCTCMHMPNVCIHVCISLETLFWSTRTQILYIIYIYNICMREMQILHGPTSMFSFLCMYVSIYVFIGLMMFSVHLYIYIYIYIYICTHTYT
jgi:hypothetical protein